jgi:hypothetical protein
MASMNYFDYDMTSTNTMIQDDIYVCGQGSTQFMLAVVSFNLPNSSRR